MADAVRELETVIEPNRRWFHIPWRELVEYRDLLVVLVTRDFIARYKQTVLGPAWFILNPLATTLVFTVVFNRVARIPTDGLPPVLFYMCGTLSWGYFAACFGGTSNSLAGNAGLFGKVYFPRLIMPLSKAASALYGFAIQLASFAAFWLYFKFGTAAGAALHLGWSALLLPLLVVQMAALGVGLGLVMSALSAKYRDFGYVTGFLTNLLFYATPVVYPLSSLPERWRWVAAANPMGGIVECFRYALLGAGTVRPGPMLASVGLTVALLLGGIVAFNRAERTFIDTV
jgi:lipopolysaccharide transport system permease protein